MLHRPECQKYRQWKLEQAKKSKGAEKKDKKKGPREPIADCLDDEEEQVQVTDASLRIDTPRCREKRRKKRIKTKLRPGLVAVRVSLRELLLKKIQPPVEVRERFYNLRHIPCLYHTAPESAVATGSKDITGMSLPGYTRAKRYPPRICKAKKKAEGKSMKGGKKSKGVQRKREGETGEESKDETSTEDKSEQNVKDQPKRKKARRKMVRRQRDTESESESSECDSICSFDSEVCLAGLKLTASDKRKLMELKRPSQDANGEEKN